MASLQNNTPHRRYDRSGSTPPLSLLQDDEQHKCDTTTFRTRDLETTTYDEERRRKELQALRDEYSDFANSFGRRALHYKSVRENPTLRGFFDTARDFDQELLDLKFLLLAGPNQVRYLPEDDAENAKGCIHRTMTVLETACGHIWRCVDLWAVHAHHDAGDKLVYSAVLKKFVSPGMLDVELKCQRNWEKSGPRLERLLKDLKSEVPRMRRVVRQLEGNKELSFVRELKNNSPPGKALKAPAFLPACLTSAGSRQYEMSGALPVDDSARKTPAWVNNMKVRLEGHTINDPAEVDFGAVPGRIRYRELKAWEKLQGEENPEAMKDAWVALLADLDRRGGPHSTDAILLRHKVVTEVRLALRRIQEQDDR
ncbi:uncharacterized protein F4812DRAFT_439958 [Daldinia caldariorum]|uniref:uncharacterized protein n=1 Tax=Daldinia caldariorum TaxID=326644 RepID=UPI002008DCC4|nr:uncharacterized protein F4812DRAFT_439958 [Daldinia caldariorum]KAI1465183.1 hypothetical protein F4812DRAFT_439958 [Daldinia caldariorum]